jgi:HPt (histidine-containing phosphotransfer) domain-containing protein
VLRACGRAVPDWRGAPSAGNATPTDRTSLPASSEPILKDASMPLPGAIAPQSAQPEPVDWQGLAASLGAGEAFVNQLAQALVRNLSGKSEALRSAAGQLDHEVLRMQSHAIKGIAGNVKAQTAFELAQRTEAASKAMAHDAPALARELANEVERVMASAQSRLGI